MMIVVGPKLKKLSHPFFDCELRGLKDLGSLEFLETLLKEIYANA